MQEGYGVIEDLFTLTSRKSASGHDSPYQISTRIQVKLSHSPIIEEKPIEKPEGLPDCLRCGYLEKLYVSQKREIKRLEDSRSSFFAVKQAVEEHYDPDKHIYKKGINPELEELGIKIPEVSPFSTISKQEALHLRETISGLNQKLKGLQLLQNDLRATRKQLLTSQVKRVQLEESVTETTQELTQRFKAQGDKHSQLIQERTKIMQQHLELKQRFSDKVLENDQLRSTIAELQAKNHQFEVEEYNFRTMKYHINSLQKELETSQRKREELRNNYDHSLKDFCNEKDLQLQNIERLQTEKSELMQKIEKLHDELKTQKTLNEELTKNNLNLESTVKKHEGKITILEDENSELQQIREILSLREGTNVELEEKIHNSAKAFECELSNLMKTNHTLQEGKTELTRSLARTANTLENKIEEIHYFTKENYQLRNTITSLEE